MSTLEKVSASLTQPTFDHPGLFPRVDGGALGRVGKAGCVERATSQVAEGQHIFQDICGA